MNVQDYYYTYGAGTQSNRKVSFNLDENKDFAASVSALSENKWKEISILRGEQVEIEMMSTSDKVRALIERRKGMSTPMAPNKFFQDLSLKEKKRLINQLEPNGPWRLEMANSTGESAYFETVTKITFFNPS